MNKRPIRTWGLSRLAKFVLKFHRIYPPSPFINNAPNNTFWVVRKTEINIDDHCISCVSSVTGGCFAFFLITLIATSCPWDHGIIMSSDESWWACPFDPTLVQEKSPGGCFVSSTLFSKYSANSDSCVMCLGFFQGMFFFRIRLSSCERQPPGTPTTTQNLFLRYQLPTSNGIDMGARCTSFVRFALVCFLRPVQSAIICSNSTSIVVHSKSIPIITLPRNCLLVFSPYSTTFTVVVSGPQMKQRTQLQSGFTKSNAPDLNFQSE